MKSSKISSLSRIKSNHKAVVKATSQTLGYMTLLCALCALPHLTRADEAEVTTPSEEKTVPNEEALPDIEAKTYDVSVARKSASQRAYLFNDTSDSKPPPGRILLLKSNNEPVMALRVLKNYTEKKQFAAKRVRTYGEKKALEENSNFLVIEKIADIIPQPPTAQDKTDLKDLELDQPAAMAAPPMEEPPSPLTDEVPPPTAPDAGEPAAMPPPAEIDEELDDTPRTPAPETLETLNAEDLQDSEQPITADEIPNLDNNRYWLALQGAYLRNKMGEAGPSYNSGMGLRYGITLGRTLFLHQKSLQDSLVLEAGMFMYKIIGYTRTTTGSVSTTSNDAYTLIPTTAVLRYNIMASENLSIFFYGGILKNNVLSSVNATETALSNLSCVVPAAGGGLMFRIAPNWHARVDLGYEAIGLGLSLRF